jgi:hypothetical protein
MLDFNKMTTVELELRKAALKAATRIVAAMVATGRWSMNPPKNVGEVYSIIYSDLIKEDKVV